MQAAPELSLSHLEKELYLLHRQRHRTLRGAIFARLADPSSPPSFIQVEVGDRPVRYEVKQVQSELELRLHMAKADSDPVVYLVPFSRRLPRDLESRFAGGRVWWPRSERQLPRRFGSRSATPRLFESALRRVAQLEGARQYAEGECANVDLDQAWMLLVNTHLGLNGGDATLARWFIATLLDDDTRGAALGSLLDQVDGARAELDAVLQRRLGPVGPLVVQAWMNGKTDLLGAAALVGEATRTTLKLPSSEDHDKLLLVLETAIVHINDHPLQSVLQHNKRAGLARTLLDLGAQVPLVWPELYDKAPKQHLSALYQMAEHLLSTKEARALASASRWLPFVFERRVRTFLDRVRRAAESKPAQTVTCELFKQIQDAADDVRAHESAATDALLTTQTQMATRLLAFMTRSAPAPLSSPAKELAALARFYAEEGGYLDWARQELRSDTSSPYKKELLPLLDRADKIRDELDRRFATAYVELVRSKGGRQNLEQVVPIERALDRFALKVLQADQDLGLLVLCLDGMSWVNLAELWQGIAERHPGLTPLTLPGQTEGQWPLPVIAQVPTETALSRSALFAGGTPTSDTKLTTTKDPELFKRHPTLVKMGIKPSLILKKELTAAGGGLSDDVAKLIAGPSRVVGVVVNAIDDQLRGSSQIRVRLSAESITPLQGLLEAAVVAGRLVLLCSDHGNVSSQRFIGTPAYLDGKVSGGGTRWRFLAKGEQARAGEMCLPADPIALPEGAAAIAVAADETTRYSAHLHAGEHGGLTLAETVAPAVLLCPSARLSSVLAAAKSPPAQTEIKPPWFWDPKTVFAMPGAPTCKASVRSNLAVSQQKRKGSPSATTPDKLPLFPHEPLATKESLPNPQAEVVEALFKSKLFRAMRAGRPAERLSKVQKALRFLIERGGFAGRDPLGEEMGMMSTRVPGLVAFMAELLNVDQEQVITMDSRKTQVRLDLPLLRQLFLEDQG